MVVMMLQAAPDGGVEAVWADPTGAEKGPGGGGRAALGSPAPWPSALRPGIDKV